MKVPEEVHCPELPGVLGPYLSRWRNFRHPAKYPSSHTYLWRHTKRIFSCIKAQGRFMRVLIRVWIFSYFPLFYVQVWIGWIPAKVLGLQSNWYSVKICASNALCVKAGSSGTEKGQRPCEANRFWGIHTRSISIMQKPMVRPMSKIWSAQNYYITSISPDIFKSLTLTTTSTYWTIENYL